MRRRWEDLEIVPDYGKRIKEAREARGLSREDLAALVGIKVATLRSIENQDIPLDIETAMKLEEVLGIKLLQEVGETEDRIADVEAEIRGADIMAFRSRWDEVRKKKRRRKRYEKGGKEEVHSRTIGSFYSTPLRTARDF